MRQFRLEDSSGFLINRAALKLKNELLQTFKLHGYNITTEQWAVLMCLSEQEAQTQSELAEKIEKDKTNLSRILDGMEKKEFITRRPHENDRRSYRIFLTSIGEELIDKLKPLAMKSNERGLQGLSEKDKREIKRLMNTIYQNLS